MTFDDHATSYRFVDRWRVRGRAEEVAEVLRAVTEYPRWWPSTYIEVTQDDGGDESGVGQMGFVHARGWLPYHIRFAYRVTESEPPRRFALAATGDLTGAGVWELSQDGDWVDATFTWTVRSEKPLLRRLSFALKPLFESNHRWTMRKGERSMQIELDRRLADLTGERTSPGEIPGPVSAARWLGAGAVFAAALTFVALLAKRRPGAFNG